MMSVLAALDQDFNKHLARMDDPFDDPAAASRRLGELMGEIARTPPQSIGDCIVKLARLADPDLGIDAGDHEDDVPSLRQVIAFLAALW